MGELVSKYPLCEEVGLKPSLYTTGDNEKLLMASDVEALLLRGVRVYGDDRLYGCTTDHRAKSLTHQGLLIDYKPIPKPKPVTKEEIKALLGWYGDGHGPLELKDAVDLLKRALDAGVE